MRKKHFVIQWLVQSHTASKCQSQNWNEFFRFLVQYFLSPIIPRYFEPTTKFRDKKKIQWKTLKSFFPYQTWSEKKKKYPLKKQEMRSRSWRMSERLKPKSACVQYEGDWLLVTGHWSLVTCDDPNLFTDNPMETPRFYQVVVGLVGEWCHKVGSLKVWGSQWGGQIPSSKTGLGRRGGRRVKTTPKWYLTRKTGVIAPLSPGSYVQEIISMFLRDVH